MRFVWIMKLCVIVILLLLGVAQLEGKSTKLEEDIEDLIELIRLDEDGDSDSIEIEDESDDDDEEILTDKSLQTRVLDDYKSHYAYRCLTASKDFYQSVKDAALFAHNHLRHLHGVPPLEWDEYLAEDAQKHANSMAENRRAEHTNTMGRWGENVAYRGISKKNIVIGLPTMIQSMYNEMINPGYDFTTNSGAGTGHFTQIVWASTTLVGCGLASATDGKWEKTYLSCRYLPPGNVNGQFYENVPEPQELRPATPEDTDINVSCDFFWKCWKKSYMRQCSTSDGVQAICDYSCHHED